MNRCKECYNMECIFVTGERTDIDTSECADFHPMTNADRIRTMTDEELADRIMGFVRCEACEREFHIECNPLMTCRGVWLEWLKSPVKDGAE